MVYEIITIDKKVIANITCDDYQFDVVDGNPVHLFYKNNELIVELSARCFYIIPDQICDSDLLGVSDDE